MSKQYRAFAAEMKRRNANCLEMLEQAPAGSALAQLTALAKQIRAQRPLLSQAQSFGEAMAQRPDLYTLHEEERGMA